MAASNQDSSTSPKRSFQLTNSQYHQLPYSLPVPVDTPVQGETRPFRNARFVKGLCHKPEDSVNTAWDIVQRAAVKFGKHNAIGSRTVIRTHVKEGPADANGEKKQFSIPELSEYTFLSYSDYQELVRSIGSGLVKAGLKPGQDKLCIWAQTSAPWLEMFHGATSQAIPIVTAYSNLGLSGIQHALVSTNVVAIFVDASSSSNLASTLKSVPCLRVVVYRDDSNTFTANIPELEVQFPHIQFFQMDELCALGKDNLAASNDPKAEDLCAIMYTSGSTGHPKGVPIKHKHLVAGITGFDMSIGKHFNTSDIYLAYLPLAHILEWMGEQGLMYRGVCIGYGSPRSIFNSSVENCKGDISELRPTYMVGVPGIWEAVRKILMGLIATFNPEKQAVFWEALAAKKKVNEEGAVFPVDRDETAFREARNIFGGQLRFMVTGGGPIAEHTQQFISFVVAPLVGGFGMTETTGIGAMMDPNDWHSGSLGSIPACAEVKLVDYEEAGYLASNSPPEGEIWIRGGSITEGYWNDEEETKKAFTDDGWFKTGDIGKMDDRGALWIIDRKKSLVKTLNGEYIALEKLESIYRTAPVVSNICLYAHPTRAKPIAIIVPVERVLSYLESATNGEQRSVDSIHINAGRLALIQLQEKAREYNLASIETVEAVVLSPLQEWDVSNGMTLGIGKLNRKAILEKHEGQVKALYNKEKE